MQLLQAGSSTIIARLATASAKTALQCQGVKRDQLVQVVDVLDLQNKRHQTARPGERKKVLHSWEHAKQLLGQVLWEEAIINGTWKPDFSDSSEVAEAPNSGIEHYQLRSPPTRYPISRPTSARDARLERHENGIQDRRRHLEDRLQQAQNAQNSRSRQLHERSDYFHDNLTRGEEQIARFMMEQQMSMKHYNDALNRSRRVHHKVQDARFDSEAQHFSAAHRAQSAERAATATRGRFDRILSKEQHTANLAQCHTERRNEAVGRKETWLGAKTVHQVQQETSRKLQQFQKYRLDDLRAGERQCLQETLEMPVTFDLHRYD